MGIEAALGVTQAHARQQFLVTTMAAAARSSDVVTLLAQSAGTSPETARADPASAGNAAPDLGRIVDILA